MRRPAVLAGPSDGRAKFIHPVGGKTLQDSVPLLRYRGRIVNLGVAGRDFGAFNPLPLCGKNGVRMSLSTFLSNEHPRAYNVIAECIARVAKGELRVVIDRKFALADAAKTHTYVESRAAFGRVGMSP